MIYNNHDTGKAHYTSVMGEVPHTLIQECIRLYRGYIISCNKFNSSKTQAYTVHASNIV